MGERKGDKMRERKKKGKRKRERDEGGIASRQWHDRQWR